MEEGKIKYRDKFIGLTIITFYNLLQFITIFSNLFARH
jgi:hypothetical protein